MNFLIAGVQKGGTSSVDAYLREHPRVCMARKKEVHFFDFDEHFTRQPDYKWYHRYFEPGEACIAVGEATPIYTYCPESMRRIWEYNPAMRLIVLLRNPVERAWSHWRMEHGRGDDPLDFSTAIRTETERCREALPNLHRNYSYVDRGLYAEQIRRILRYFPAEQVLFIQSEDFFADTQARMDDVCRFLRIDVKAFHTSQAHRVGDDHGEIPSEDKRFLIDVYRNDVAEVRRLLNWDCAGWLA